MHTEKSVKQLKRPKHGTNTLTNPYHKQKRLKTTKNKYNHNNNKIIVTQFKAQTHAHTTHKKYTNTLTHPYRQYIEN